MTAFAARRRRPWASAALILIGLTCTGALYALFAPASSGNSTGGAQDVAAGRQLYLANCSTCHGLNATGRADIAPSLVGVGAAAVDFQVGTGRMPMVRSGPQAPQARQVRFSSDEIAQLSAYVASLGPGPAVPSAADVDPAGGDVARGGQIFRTNCAMCHNFAGKGGALTRGKYAPDLSGSSAVHIYEAMVTGPQSMPVFNDHVIDPQGKQDIIAYLYSVRETPSPGGLSLGQLGPVVEGLVAWVVGLGLLIGAAVWLGAKAS